jgi:hypothetical protein
MNKDNNKTTEHKGMILEISMGNSKHIYYRPEMYFGLLIQMQNILPTMTTPIQSYQKQTLR